MVHSFSFSLQTNIRQPLISVNIVTNPCLRACHNKGVLRDSRRLCPVALHTKDDGANLLY